ncbi:hypothetical protein C2845_PM05G24620 [Panicum miliaceum]|uniref:Alpha/beta hydrolase fold-3 domain-containing protein n=1 Tax=Panicum miliaceum TaxID=4540 RepID=A0A3L6T633_PANMI|nr:hypothetical protein C2845_PM05G24620 [Panicum miliaceum]
MYHHFYSRLACSVPAAIISIDLLLAPERRWPTHVDTGIAALRRLRSIGLTENDGALDDPTAAKLLREAAGVSRVFLFGDSSGGNLVHFVTVRVG